MRITDYTIASANTAFALADAVREMIKKGWEPFGSIAIEPETGVQATYCQALVKWGESQ